MITIREAMTDLRTEFLARIFKDYPDHKKTWKAEEVLAEFSSAMYSVAIDYLTAIEREERKPLIHQEESAP